MPCHNGARYLERLSQHILPQLIEGDELLLVDDASSDNTREVAEALGYRVIHLEQNGGVGRARNEGARAAANGNLIFFDDDILPHESYLQTSREIFSDPSVLICQGLHDFEPANDPATLTQRVESMTWRHCMGTLLTQADGCHSVFSQSFNVRKQLFFEVGGFSGAYAGAGGEEFEVAGRIMSRTRIELKVELRTQHEFQSLGPRMRTLYRRAQNFTKIYWGMDREWKQSHVSEMLRSGLALGFFPCALTGLYDVRLLWGLPLIAALFVLIDASFVINLVTWRLAQWVPLCLFQRFAHYVAISSGLVRSYI